MDYKKIIITTVSLLLLVGIFLFADYHNKQYPKIGDSKTEEKTNTNLLSSLRNEGSPLSPLPLKEGTAEANISAKSAKIIDLRTNYTFYEKAPDTKLSIASLTKIMTAFVVMENVKRTDIITVPNISNSPGEAVMGLLPGEKLKAEELLKGLLIHSAGDAAETLAVHVAGSEAKFVEMMNKKAVSLSLKNTHFANPVGLDSSGNYSSANDLTNLSRVILENKDFREIIKTANYTAKSEASRIYNLTTTNKILDNQTVFGLKTGFTFEAGECLITLAKIDNHEVLITLIGSQDRFGETRGIIKWVGDNFEW